MNKNGFNLFIRNCSSFQEFFGKAKLLSHNDQGLIFERLTQLILKTSPKYSSLLTDVWLLNEVPDSVRKYLRLPSSDEGIDLIAKSKSGEYWAVQSKFRSNPDESLKWGGRGGLATFKALAFTTCKNIQYGLVVATNNKPLRKIHLSGEEIGYLLFEELTQLDDDNYESWNRIRDKVAKKSLTPPEPYEPRTYQQKAINSAVRHFNIKEKTRGKLIMPCGTGKSLTSFWITNELDVKNIIVAVPSLALIKQTLNVWVREFLSNEINTSWLCVCSDEQAGEVDTDSFTSSVYELGVPCTTNIEKVNDFLIKNDSDVKIVFTTYQSGKVVASASRLSDFTFDLGVFDEAHKTVGNRNKVFAHLLFDENINISKRLFMTATERYYRGNSEQIVSMHNQEIYGETFELLTFKKAIESKDPIISDYKFVTIEITQSEIETLWNDNAYVRIDETELNEDTIRGLASGLAIRKAYSELGIKRAITFHKSIKLASRFKNQQEILKRIYPDLDEISTFHVSSKTATGERSVQLREFGKVRKGLITNARCLTEGVDIPSVDCVMFVDPRKSKVDIVQAAGRAMRKSKKKKYGYIIVPIVVPNKVDIEDYSKSTDFDQVVTTIKALASEDERIVEELRDISQGKASSGNNIIINIPAIVSRNISSEEFIDGIKLKVWSKLEKIHWLPFEEARKIVRSFSFENSNDYKDWAKTSNRREDIPYNPWLIYKDKGWTTWGDWLGTGRVANQLLEFLAYEEARDFARSLNLTNGDEWRKYSKGEISNLPEKPDNIPANPEGVYRNKGWSSWGDWLGTGSIASYKRKYYSFKKARSFVHKLRLSNSNQWREYCKGNIPEKGILPSEIPANPHTVYKNKGWISYGDWLGTFAINNRNRTYSTYDKSKAFVHKLKLKSRTDWEKYTKGEIKRNKPLPEYIPASPSTVYKNKGWISWGDWLGTGSVSVRDRKYITYQQAIKFVRKLKLKSFKEWQAYCQGKRKDLPSLPFNIPTNPNRTYQNNGWDGWGNWLGTGFVAPQKRQHMPFKAARKFVHSLHLKGQSDWRKYCKGEIDSLPVKPDNIPNNPDIVYKNTGWSGYADWVGKK